MTPHYQNKKQDNHFLLLRPLPDPLFHPLPLFRNLHPQLPKSEIKLRYCYNMANTRRSFLKRGQIGQCCQRLATAAAFLRKSCVGAITRKINGPHKLVVVVVVLPDPFRGMGARRNSAETQQSGHTPRSGP